MNHYKHSLLEILEIRNEDIKISPEMSVKRLLRCEPRMDKASQDIIWTVPQYIFVHLESKTVQTSCRILSGLVSVVGTDKS